MLPELAQKMNKKDGRLVHVIQKLKDALKTFLELKDISSEFNKTYDDTAKDVKKSIDVYIDQILDEISQSESDISKADEIKNIEPLFKQIV